MKLMTDDFGSTLDGKSCSLWNIHNEQGLSVSLTDWGARIVSVKYMNKQEREYNLCLGYKNVEEYIRNPRYLGATCGRYANRIAQGKFTLEGKSYQLICNTPPHHLHGGTKGFNAQIWKAQPYTEGNRSGVVFSHFSPHGEEGYPGNLNIQADYAINGDNQLFMNFHAETDHSTIINITNHVYWNFQNQHTEKILNHRLKLYASSYLPVDKDAIPLGSIASVKNTPFDFLTEKEISRDIATLLKGYDHCFVIDGEKGKLKKAAEVFENESRIGMTLFTDRLGLQFYSGNHLDAYPFDKNTGFCLEPQDFPNAPNQHNFPKTVLSANENYHHRSMIEFNSK